MSDDSRRPPNIEELTRQLATLEREFLEALDESRTRFASLAARVRLLTSWQWQHSPSREIAVAARARLDAKRFEAQVHRMLQCVVDEAPQVREAVHELTLGRLLHDAGQVYGPPGRALTLTTNDLPRTLCVPQQEGELRPVFDLVAVFAYLERTFGEDAGRDRAAHELRDAVRRSLGKQPMRATTKGRGAIILRARARRFAWGIPPKSGHVWHDSADVRRTVLNVGHALDWLAESVDLERVAAVCADRFADDQPIDRHARYDLGCGLTLVTFTGKVVIEMPASVARSLATWLSIDDCAIVAPRRACTDLVTSLATRSTP